MARFVVTVAAHRVADRWDIPATEKVVGSDTQARARLRLLRWLHADAGVPPLKSYLRESWRHSAAIEYVMTKEEHLRERARRNASR